MSKFIERHKRKSLLAVLLLIFKGRRKYIALSLVMVALSVPFVVSEDMVSKFIDLPAVRSILKLTGFDSLLSSINPNYSRDAVKLALQQIAEESQKYSIWQKFLQGLSGSDQGNLAGDSRGTIGMVKVGDLYNEGKNNKSGIKGVLSEDEKNKGETADSVNLADLANVDPSQMIAGAGAFGNGNNFGFGSLVNYGGGGLSNGQLSAGNRLGFENRLGFGTGFGLESRLGYGAYINRNIINERGGISYKKDGMIAKAMDMSNIPEPNEKLKAGKYKRDEKVGRTSPFSWKNVGHKVDGRNMDVRISTHKKALFQMAETFTMTAAAYKMNKGYEYQAAYTGATYDGNDINVGLVTTEAVPEMPDTGFTGDLMQSAEAYGQLAKECGDSQATDGQAITDLSNQMKAIRQSMGNPPKCCNHGAVRRWNNNVRKMRDICKQINQHNATLSQKCQSPVAEQANCSGPMKGAMEIKPCSKWKCWLGMLLPILAIVAGIGLLLGGFTLIGLALIVGGAAMLLGQLAGGIFGTILSAIGGFIAGFFSQAAALAISVANKITSLVTGGSVVGGGSEKK